jgi:hypothetical protein
MGFANKCLQNMIAAYADLRLSTCTKCSKTLDDGRLPTVARRSKSSTEGSETSQTIWQGFHEGCL